MNLMIPTSKDRKYLAWAEQGAQIFSTCSKRQYMAIITDHDGFAISIGYNGSAKGMPHCVDGGCPRAQQNSPSGSSYDNCIAIHAEQNALLRADYSQVKHGGTLYVNGPPCFTCAKLIANSGLDRVVCIDDDGYAQWPEVKAFLIDSGIAVKSYHRDEL